MKATKKAAKGIAATKNPVQKKTAAKKPANPPKCGGVKCGSPKKGEVNFGSLGYLSRKYALKDVKLLDEEAELCKSLAGILKKVSTKRCPLNLVSMYEVNPKGGKVHYVAFVEGGRGDAKDGNDWAFYSERLSAFFAKFGDTPVKTWLLELQNDCRNDRFFALVGFVTTGADGKGAKVSKPKGKRK